MKAIILFFITLNCYATIFNYDHSISGKSERVFNGIIGPGGAINTEAVSIAAYPHVAIHLVYPGGSVGTCNMEVSNDKVNWVIVTGASATLGDGNDIINKTNLGSQWVRASCVNGSIGSNLGTTLNPMRIYIGAK